MILVKVLNTNLLYILTDPFSLTFRLYHILLLKFISLKLLLSLPQHDNIDMVEKKALAILVP